MQELILVFVVAGALCGLFAATYLFARKIDNYGVVDVAWSFAFGLVAIAYALALDGWVIRRAIVAVVVFVWSVRLGSHLWIRVARHHPAEDPRYRKLRQDWASAFARKMAGFFQLQAVSVVLLSAPFFLVANNPSPAVHPLEIAGTLLWILAVTGEAVADAQLAAFKRKSAGANAVCDVGLWRYSRHPNYFFEWLIWISYALLALPAPQGWLGFVSPACILWLLLRVTGIPMTEEQSLRTKGDAFRAYQRKTSAFVPWPPRA